MLDRPEPANVGFLLAAHVSSAFPGACVPPADMSVRDTLKATAPKRDAFAAMGEILFEQRESDLVVITFPAIADDLDFETYLRRLDAQLAAKRIYATVLVAADDVRTPLTQRKRQAEWMRLHAVELARWCVGTAFVLPSPIKRVVLATIMLIQPLPTPYVICNDLGDALAWARARLDRLRSASLAPTRVS